MASKHQLVIKMGAMGYVLEGFLDTERSRVCLTARRPLFILRPVGKTTRRQATHAFDLVPANAPGALWSDKYQR